MMPGVERPAFNLQCLAFTLGGTVLAVIHDHILTIMAIQFSKSGLSVSRPGFMPPALVRGRKETDTHFPCCGLGAGRLGL
jgi:hypothetical protein